MYAFGTKNQQVQVSLKLVVSKETNKVLFAEAGKDFVDILISFLTLPLGTIARLVAKESSDMQPTKVGSLSSLYQSVANLDDQCLWTDTCKEMLLQPRNSMEDYCRSLKINIDDTEPTQYYVCDNLKSCRHESRVMLTTFKNKECSCGDKLAQPISPKSSNVFEGFVKTNESFIITNDLSVIPNSLDAMFCLLKSFGMENASSVDAMSVNVTKDKLLDLLKSSMLSRTTLTDVFMEKKLFLEKYELARLPALCDFAGEVTPQISVKVMYRKSDSKIVLVQGKEDFADLLLSFLTFPLGGVLRMFEGYSSMGSVDGLFKSIVDLNEDYFKTQELKDKLVDLRLAPHFKLSNQIFPFNESDVPTYFCYTKSHKSRKKNIILDDFYLTSTYIEDCDNNNKTCTALDIVGPISNIGSAKGFVKGPSMYIATDDLVVTPLTSVSVISLLHNMNVSFSDLEEKVVSIGFKEGLNILKASLTSSTALSYGLGHLLTKVKEEK